MLTKYEKETLNQLSKGQLIYLIEQLYNSQLLISKICSNEPSICNCLYSIPNLYQDPDDIKTHIDEKIFEQSKK